jgi:hypothetical protein
MKFRNTLSILLSLSFAYSAKVKDDNLPQFSLASGFYNEDSIELEITTRDPNSIIYYTLDGTMPTENSTVYEGPFILTNKSLDENVVSSQLGIVVNSNFTPSVKVNKGNVIRAVVKPPNGNLTSVVSKSYFVGLDKKALYQDLPVINIITDPANLFDYEKGIYVLGKMYDENKNNNPFGGFGDWGNWNNTDGGDKPAWGGFGGNQGAQDDTGEIQWGNFGGNPGAPEDEMPTGGIPGGEQPAWGGFGGNQGAQGGEQPAWGGFGGNQGAQDGEQPAWGNGDWGNGDWANGNFTMGDWGDWGNFTMGSFDWAAMFATGNFNQKGKEGERPATIEFIPGDENLVTLNQDVGIRLKGRSTRAQYQKSFNIRAREEYGKKNIKYELIEGNMRSDGKGPVEKYKSFNLRNSGNDSENAKMRDVVIQELFKNDLVDTQQNQYSIVFIDGEYWGIYQIYEEYNDNYIANNYDIDNENIIMVKEGKLEAGEEADSQIYQDAVDFIANNDMSIPSNYQKATELYDMVGYALYCAFYAYVDVQDGYYRVGNYAMWRVKNPDSSVPQADGRWRMMIYDTDLSFGGMWAGDGGYDSDVVRDILSVNDPSKANQNQGFGMGNWFLQNIGVKITASLLKNEEFKNMFINYLCDLKNIYFEPSRVDSVIDEKKNLLLPLVEEHYQRNGPAKAIDNAVEDFSSKVESLRNSMQMRNKVFLGYIQEDFDFEPAVKVTVTANDFGMGKVVVNGINEFTKDYTGEYFKENILYITAVPNNGRKVKSWVIKNCKSVSRTGNSRQTTIGIRPKRDGCIVRAVFN